jgi:carbon-monoxide dehydrogenase medium subunit
MLAKFDYTVPETLSEAVAMLAATTGSRPLAGGQVLLNAMKAGRAAPPRLVDLRRISGLHGIHATDHGQLWIGALTTLDELLDQPMLDTRSVALVDAARATGDPQLRNRATVGGCLASRRVPSHLAAALLVAEATLTVVGASGERVVSAGEFYAADRPGLAPDEILTAVQLPMVPVTVASAYERIADRASGDPICGVAVAVSRTSHGTLETVRIAVTGATRRPTRLAPAEQALVGSGAPVDTSHLPVGRAEAYVDDDRASADYRAHLTRVLVGRAIARS